MTLAEARVLRRSRRRSAWIMWKLAILAAVSLACLALPGTAAATTPTVTIGNVDWAPSGWSTVDFDVTRSSGSAWHGRCDYSGTYTDWNGVSGNTFTGSDWPYGQSYMIEYDVGQDVESWDSITVTCKLDRRVAYMVKVTEHGQATKRGSWANSRSSAADNYFGSCNWGGDGFGGLISTCLDAHAAVDYRLVVPSGKTFAGVTHAVSAGLVPCHNTKWSISHADRVYTARFFHGSPTGWSQCDIDHVTLHYKWTARVTRHRTVTTTATDSWIR
jgi:hypothetical protein